MRSIAWIAVLSLVALTQVAEAGRRGARGSNGSEGSVGGSGGSMGGSGGSSGGAFGSRRGAFGSSGGAYGSSGGAFGSSGGAYGSSGGAYGSMGGAYGSSGGAYGSMGGSIGSYGGSAGGVAGYPVTAVSTDRAHLVLHVPADATVYMLDQKMTMDGSVRNFVTPKLENGKVYSVNVRVEWQREGQKYVARGTQKIRSGDKVEVEAKLNEAGTSLLLAHRDGQKNVLELTAGNAAPAAPKADAPGIANNSR